MKCNRCKGNGRVEMLEHCPLCDGSGSMEGFYKRLAYLNEAQKAFAVHVGEVAQQHAADLAWAIRKLELLLSEGK